MPSIIPSFMGRWLNKKDSDHPDQQRVQNTDMSTDWARFQQNNSLLNLYPGFFPAFGVQSPASNTDGISASDEPAADAVALDAPVDTNINARVMALGTPDGGAAPVASQNSENSRTELLVQFDAGSSLEQRESALARINATILEIVRPADSSAGDLVLIKTPAEMAPYALEALQNAPGVKYAEPNWSIGVQAVSNDTYYANGSLWGMYGDLTTPANRFGSQAGEAWGAGFTGSSKIVIGDIDTGIDYTHQDLYLNVWLNQGELPVGMGFVDADTDGLITFRDLNNTLNSSFVSDINLNGRIDAGDLLNDARWENGLDQDSNGYIDDLIGWDFVNNDNDPYDDNGHGSHTAGTIGANGGNGTGVAGVTWNVQLMGLKFLSATGSGSTTGAIKATDYYTSASILDQTRGWTSEFIGTNNSWGGGGYSQSMLDAIVRGARQDALFIAAAGNGGSDGIGDNNDSLANYPSNYSTLATAGFEAVIAVAATTSSGALASYSNYGATTVDLGAPGSSIWSTVPGGGYASYSGTSMATPHVTGALALYAAQNPTATASQLRTQLLSTTTSLTSLANKTVTGGTLDVGKMIATPGVTPPSTGVTLYGTTGNDRLTGTDFSDVLSGVPATGTSLGRGSVDTLTGKLGNDLFLLGDARGRFYDDGNSKNAGKSDYALITDFLVGSDQIQLASGNYFLSATSINGASGTGIYFDSNANRAFGSTDELIGLVQNVSTSSLTSSSFTWA